MITALLLYLGVIIVIVVVAGITEQLAVTAAFLLLFILFIFPPLFKALKTLSERHVGKAVKAGVLGLILMNACWAAVGAGWAWAIATALLLPVSIWTAKTFAVT
jgi:4-hydroxybenzoate polyprenyltransferase